MYEKTFPNKRFKHTLEFLQKHVSTSETIFDLGVPNPFSKIMEEVFVMLKDDEDSGHNMYLEYAHIYLDLHEKPEQALVYAQKEIDKRPANIDVNRMLPRVYKAKSDHTMAQKYAMAACVTNSKHPELEPLMAKI